jgi:hypothetical protein
MPLDIGKILRECVQAAAAQQDHIALDYQLTALVDTETATTNLAIRFATAGPNAFICLTRLITLLEQQDGVVSNIDAYGPPACEVVISGVLQREPFKIVLELRCAERNRSAASDDAPHLP